MGEEFVTATVAPVFSPQAGEQIRLAVDLQELQLFDAESGGALVHEGAETAP